MLGQITVGGAVGATAWVVPQILTMKPAGATATLSGKPPVSEGTVSAGPPVASAGVASAPSTVESAGEPTGASTSPGTTSNAGEPVTSASLAATGIDLQQEAEIGAILVAAGWAVHRWASRGSSEPATTDTEG